MTLPVSRKRILLASLLAAVGLLATSCGSSSDNTDSTPQITEPRSTLSASSGTTDSDSSMTSTPSETSTASTPLSTKTIAPRDDPLNTATTTASTPSITTIPPTTTTLIPPPPPVAFENVDPSESDMSDPPSPDLPPAIDVAAGWLHTCAMHKGGTVSCWGSSFFRELDLGEPYWPDIPELMQDLNGAIDIISGADYACTLQRDGIVNCWGDNAFGQLGRGRNSSDKTHVPRPVEGIDDATVIASGGLHTCAIHISGAISCWGDNAFGQLGSEYREVDSYYDGSYSPVRVDNIDDAIAIAASGSHTCAIHLSSTISCWGGNSYGQLGTGEGGTDPEDRSADSSTPVQVTNISDAISIGVGYGFSCALHRSKTVSCWGGNKYGQLGNGQIGEETSSAVPQVVNGITDAISLSVARFHACILHEGGKISCWGNNEHGQLGNGIYSTYTKDEIVDSGVPVQVFKISDAIAITTGDYHSCALHEDGTISCWGREAEGQVGNLAAICWLQTPLWITCDYEVRANDDRHRTTAARVDVVNVADAGAVAAGDNHTCALHEGGTVSCWGSNSHGQLGSGEAGAELDTAEPTSVAGIAGAAAVATSENHTCAVMEDGTVRCWGNNSSGQLGNGRSGINRDDRSENTAAPVAVMGIDDATEIATGWDHTCALVEDSTVSCWGSNSFGQLGDGTNRSASAPVKTADISDAIAIAAGWDHTCALIRNGSIYCWGNNLDGNLGDGTTSNSSVPVRVAEIADASAISADGNHTCALTQSGDVYCWGSNSHDQLGDGPLGCGAIVTMGCAQRNRADSPIPLQVTISEDVAAISAGDFHTCALHEDGTASCWGNNQDGQLGDGTTDRSLRPVKAADLPDATAITAGSSHTCALRESSTITCWGNNQNEQLGDGHLPRTPQKVTGIGG